MAIRKSFNGQSIYQPGPYSRFSVDNSAGSALGSSDVMFIIGESSKGAPGATTGITEFGAVQLSQLIEMYGSGPIIDCAVAASSPSNTPGIGSPGRFLVYKTNASLAASAALTVSTDTQFTISDRAYGQDGNLLTAVITSGTTANQKMISIQKLAGTSENLGENEAQNILSIEYVGNGSAASMAITGATRAALTLATTLSGQTDTSVDLNIPLAGLTIKNLVDMINEQDGYTAILLAPNKASTPATDLDPRAPGSILSAVNLLRIQAEVRDLLNTSTRIQAVETDILGGVLDNQSKALSGGSQGASSNANFSAGLATSLSSDYNLVIPAISRDASEDISAGGFTNNASTYTLASVLAAVSSHLTLRGNTKNKKEAQAIVGIKKATKADAFAQAATLNDYQIQAVMEDLLFLDATGTLKVGQPHVLAAMIGGIRLGTPVGEPLTHKVIKAGLVGHNLNATTLLPAGDLNVALDADDAIINGMMLMEKRGNAYRIMVDNTTYGIDESFVFNRGSVVEAANFVMKDIRNLADELFIGKKVSNGIAQSIKSAIRNRLRELNAPDVQIITSSANAPEGFREDTFTVTVQGNTATVNLEFCPVQGLDFVLFNFVLGDIEQSA